MGEVLESLPAELQSFLLRTSVLERFTAEACRDVLRDDVAGEGLREIERRNLFLVPLDDEGRWFRYHHMFRDFLRREVERRRRRRSPRRGWRPQSGSPAGPAGRGGALRPGCRRPGARRQLRGTACLAAPVRLPDPVGSPAPRLAATRTGGASHPPAARRPLARRPQQPARTRIRDARGRPAPFRVRPDRPRRPRNAARLSIASSFSFCSPPCTAPWRSSSRPTRPPPLR